MNKKGFTLIELLAVIVILAIIALIATPIVLNIIKDSRESAGLRSAEMYLKGVETSVATATLNNKTITDGTYPITLDGDICLVALTENKCDKDNTLAVEMNGDKPESGSITIESGKIADIKLIYSNGKTIVKNDGKLVYGKKEKTEEVKTIDTICTHDTTNGVSEKTAGAKYSCEVKEGTSYNFYVLTTPKSGDTTINLIMERNICEDGTLATSENTCNVAWQTSGVNTDGPVTAMDYLYNATKDWANIPNIEMNYTDESYTEDGNTSDTGYGTIVTTDGITKITKKDGTAVTVLTDQEGYNNLKSRMPYYSEVSKYDSTNKTNAYLYDYLNQSGTIQTNPISGIDSYWILSSFGNHSQYAWNVLYDGYVQGGGHFVSGGLGYSYGVRPVITLKLQ